MVKSFDRLWESHQRQPEDQLCPYLVSMDIPMIGRTKAGFWTPYFSGNLTAFEQAAVGDYDFPPVGGFCSRNLKSGIHSGLQMKQILIYGKTQNEFTFEQRKEETIMTKENKFTGCTPATGKLEHFTRDNYQR